MAGAGAVAGAPVGSPGAQGPDGSGGVGLLIREVFEEFPAAAPGEELDAHPLPTVPARLLPKVKRQSKPRAPSKSSPAAAASEDIPLKVFAQSGYCIVPADVLARATRLPPCDRPELRLHSPAQCLSESTPFVSISAVTSCLEMALGAHRRGDGRAEMPAPIGWLQAVRVFASARLLGFGEVARASRTHLQRLLTRKTLRAVTAAALAWEDSELLLPCYSALSAALCQPPPCPGPTKFGVGTDHFEYRARRWPLAAFGPAAEAAAAQQRSVLSPPLEGFVVGRLQRSAYEFRLSRETSCSTWAELMRVALNKSEAMLHTVDAGGDDPGIPTFWGLRGKLCRGYCGKVEATQFGRCFSLYGGSELLPSLDTCGAQELRRSFPHAPRELLGSVSWDIDVFSPGRWRLSVEAPGLPALRSRADAAGGGLGGVELIPPGGEQDTPWLVLGPMDGRSGERALHWRHPIGTALALAVALAVSYPWGAEGAPGRA